jgi:hypothetical protein
MIAVQRLIEQTNFTCVWPNQSEQHSDRCRLAGAVWTKEAVDARRRYQQVQTFNRELRSETAR